MDQTYLSIGTEVTSQWGSSETTVGKLSARRIQIYFDYFCLGIILKVILNNSKNNA